MRWWALGFVTLQFAVVSAHAEQPSAGNGWQQIYLNDFKGMIFSGVTKQKYCVEQAFRKAHEIREKGGTYRPILALEESVQIAAKTYDQKDVLILCSPVGALAMYFKPPTSLQAVFESVQQVGTAQKLGSPEVVETRTSIDLNSGKATSTTTMPQE